MTVPSSELRERILRAAHDKPSPTRAALVRRRAIAGLASAVWLAIVVSLGHVHPDAAGIALFVVWSALAIAISAYALRTPKTSLGRPRIVLALLGPLAGALVVLTAWLGGATIGHSTDHHSGELLCWGLTVGIAAVPLLAGLWVERASDPIAPGASGAAIGAIAGAWAGVAMMFVCGRTETWHVFVGHVLSFLAIVAAAALLGRRVLMLR